MAPRPRTRAQAVEGFAAELAALRESAGRPSFRAMAGRSRAISHTTLHEASRGYRLPSWETTVEYVRACGADPDDYRDRWVEAGRRACPRPRAGTADRTRGGGRETPTPIPPTRPPAPVATPAGHAVAPGPHARLPVVLGAGVAAVVLAVVVAVDAAARVVDVLPLGDDAGGRATAALAVGGEGAVAAAPAPSPDASSVTTAAARTTDPAPTCPSSRSTEASSAAATTAPADPLTGDAMPDCSHVTGGTVATKTWLLHNTGDLPWRGYALRRLDVPQSRDTCQTIPEVPVPATAAGATVEVSVRVTMPRSPTSCVVLFALTDASGRLAAPEVPPVHLLVRVD